MDDTRNTNLSNDAQRASKQGSGDSIGSTGSNTYELDDQQSYGNAGAGAGGTEMNRANSVGYQDDQGSDDVSLS